MKLVKQLRQATGARLVDCKAAVEATTGLEEAFQWLREKGASRAAKLETRTAAHGLVAARAARALLSKLGTVGSPWSDSGAPRRG